MSKILTDKEMSEIIWNAIHDDSVIECSDSYLYFLEDLGDLICNHFGGDRGTVSEPMDESALDSAGEWCCAFNVNENVPSDGGVFSKYDTDVTWKDGEEYQI